MTTNLLLRRLTRSEQEVTPFAFDLESSLPFATRGNGMEFRQTLGVDVAARNNWEIYIANIPAYLSTFLPSLRVKEEKKTAVVGRSADLKLLRFCNEGGKKFKKCTSEASKTDYFWIPLKI